MGFGFLFAGLMMMLDTGWQISASPALGFDIFPDILGYLLMLRSMRYLKKNSRDFTLFYYVVIALCIPGTVTFISQVTGAIIRLAGLSGIAVIADIVAICGYIENPLMLVAILFLTSAIRELATDLGLYKLSRLALVSSVFSACYYLLSSVASFVGLPGFVVLAIALLAYIQLILLLVTVFSCYRQIGFEGEEDLPEKENPFEKLMKKAAEAKERSEKDD